MRQFLSHKLLKATSFSNWSLHFVPAFTSIILPAGKQA